MDFIIIFNKVYFSLSLLLLLQLLLQVQWNLLSGTSLVCDAKEGNKQASRIYTPWKEIEDNYKKFTPQDELSIKPRFYNLTVADLNSQDTPKLDGLACNFVLGTPDKMKYPLLVDALIDILNIINQTSIPRKQQQQQQQPQQQSQVIEGKDKMTFTGLCATQYCFSICWRLLLMLPPSTAYMDELALGEEIPASPMLLYSSIWGPRAACKTFTGWMKDCLVKQGMYTQYAENLLKTISSTVTCIKYDVTLAKNAIKALSLEVNDDEKIIPKTCLPKLSSLTILSAVIGKLLVTMDESLYKTSNDNVEVSKNCQSSPESITANINKMLIDILPHILKLTKNLTVACKSSVLHQAQDTLDECKKYNMKDFLVLDSIIAMDGISGSMTGASWSLDTSLVSLLPSNIRAALDKWKSINVAHVPWNTYVNDIIPAESYILATINHHINPLSEFGSFSINPSLKNLLYSLINFIMEYVNPVTAPENSEIREEAINLLIPLTMDARTDYVQEMASKTLVKILGDADSEPRQLRVYHFILSYTYNLIIDYTNNYKNNNNTEEEASNVTNVTIDEKILTNYIKYWEHLLDKPVGYKALGEFFAPNSNCTLVSILLSIASPQASQQFGTHVLHFFNKLFKTAEKINDSSLDRLCSSVSNLANVENDKLQFWLRHVILGTANIPTSTSNLPTANIAATTAMTTTAAATTTTTTTTVSVSEATEDAKKAGESNRIETNNQVSSSNWQNILIVDGNGSKNQNNQYNQQPLEENNQLLQSLTNYIVKDNSNVNSGVSVTMLQALIPLGYHILSTAIEGVSFTDLMQVMSTLADVGSDKGHKLLFKAATGWVDICKQQLMNKDAHQSLDKPSMSSSSSSSSSPYIEAGCCVLNYIADVVSAVCPQQIYSQDRATSPPWEGATPIIINDVNDSDWNEDIMMMMVHEDEDSAAEDSDEDSLCNKLCTFTITQKEFMNQHWYHCHDCNMVDGVGVCTVCARVCHRGHDVTYAKYGNFFCDCGAKDDASCQALMKRSPQSSEHQLVGNGNNNISYGIGNGNSDNNTTHHLTSSLRRRTSSPPVHHHHHHHNNHHHHHHYEKSGGDRIGKDRQKLSSSLSSSSSSAAAALSKQLDGSKDWILSQLWSSGLISSLVELTSNLVPAVEASCRKYSAVGCHSRGQLALRQLHSLDKKFEHTDQLMLPTLGSQEGAFENVRMNYSGDQGQTIRQLLSAHMIRRVAMCCLSSPHGKRQHLAVSHEKGKITVLQLSTLLKQADSSKRKLTLTRLASAPIPFTVLSITGNQWNEDFLAVCGLKDCHVLTFNSSGTVSDHLVLHPHLETGNFIIKALWLPGSQTQLALVTADFVKIYDLSKDALSPQYYFLVPTGKIRDCTFIYAEDGMFHLLLMSSAGYIYSQAMDEESLAKHGPFYVTNTLDIYHPEIKDNGQVGGGGVSIYYSHALQLLFFSYVCGKSFIAPLKFMNLEINIVFMINLVANKMNGNKSNNNQPQPLCQWSEIANHPGLVCSVMQSSNNPVILMIKPETIMIQEIKVVPAKAKIMDIVAIRHSSSNAEHRTTLILLCEDGSLRVYMAAMDQTGFWMSPNVQPVGTIATIKQTKKKKALKTGKPSGSVIIFPVDFFEHCQSMNDVEFGGNDLLQIYNVAQIKHRLNTTGMYVASTRQLGFNVEVNNNDPTLVMTGFRVQLGNQDIQRAPLFVEVS